VGAGCGAGAFSSRTENVVSPEAALIASPIAMIGNGTPSAEGCFDA
jgi:hypothetical protein